MRRTWWTPKCRGERYGSRLTNAAAVLPAPPKPSPSSLKHSTSSVFFKGHSLMLGCTLASPCHSENSRSQGSSRRQSFRATTTVLGLSFTKTFAPIQDRSSRRISGKLTITGHKEWFALLGSWYVTCPICIEPVVIVGDCTTSSRPGQSCACGQVCEKVIILRSSRLIEIQEVEIVDEEPDQSPPPKRLKDHIHPCHKQSSSKNMRIKCSRIVGSKHS